MPESAALLTALETIAPLRLAASWDNVGLLLEGNRTPDHVHCTIDLTERVLAEGLSLGADFFLAYHPPIFRGLKRLDRKASGSRMLLDAARAGVWIYSPHTAVDAVAGGMNDWLVDGLDPVAERQPIEADALDSSAGFGRIATLSRPLPMSEVVSRVKSHLGLDALRVAGPTGDRLVRRVAVCPGAGGSVFEKVGDVDLLLTGEMRHHDVLHRASEGASVILTDHTNTERGFLPTLSERLMAQLPGLRITVSDVDRDPLAVM